MQFFRKATLAAVILIAAPANATELLVNGGFEAAPVGVPFLANSSAPNGMVQQFPAPAITSQYLSGWTMTNPGQSNLQAGPYDYGLYPANAYEGSKFFSLNWSPLGSVTLYNTISQNFTLGTASNLAFAIAMATESGFNGSTLQVMIMDRTNNALVAQSGLFTNTLGNRAWDTKSWAFGLGAGDYSIALQGIGAGNAWDVLIDGARLNAVAAPSAVPEPASWAMMIMGFALTGAALRRRKTSVAFA